MNSGPAHRDVEIRAAIDELNEADKNVRGVREEVERWQQENPSPKQPKSVQRMAEIEEFEGRNQAWNKLYMEHRERLEQAQAQLHAAQEKLVSLLPQEIGYEYKGKRYQRERSSYRVDDIG
jgi:chromosome segregation ATPase